MAVDLRLARGERVLGGMKREDTDGSCGIGKYYPKWTAWSPANGDKNGIAVAVQERLTHSPKDDSGPLPPRRSLGQVSTS